MFVKLLILSVIGFIAGISLEECVGQGGPGCPTMVGTDQVLDLFTQYDYRIDVRSVGEWDDGHAAISLNTPGLSTTPASQYLDQIGGLEDRNVLVYCRGGTRAFAASLNLLNYGFKNVNSYYHGGFPDLEGAIVEQSEALGKVLHPNKNYCYLTGGSDKCPTPLPLSHIKTAADIKKLGENIQLVDVRPMTNQFKESLPNAHRVPNNKAIIKKFLKSMKKDATLVVFCKEGTLAFRAAKEMRKRWRKGALYFIDNGGYEQVKMIEGIEDL